MSNPLPPLDAIPLPGEAKSDSQNEKKKPKLRHIQDTNQPSSIIVTKVVTTKPSSKDPASKLKAIVEKKKNLPTVSNTTNSCKSPVNINMNSGPSVTNASHPKNQPVPASQTIVDELFKDFLAAKQKEEQTNVKRKDPDIANSMEEMSKLLDEEINLINSNQKKVSEKKGRWDIDVKKDEVKKKGRWDSEHKKTVDHPGEKDISHTETKESSEGGESVDDIGENGKKALVKLGLKLEISKESISWINSGEVMDQKKKVVLEEGEVLSSSTDENSEESDESDKDEELMETGSLSNSDREKSKSKKKKKHKHKHKKKKKHKSGKSDRKSKDKSSKDDKESKKESKDGKKKDKDEKKDRKKEDHKSKSAEKRRRTRSRSKSPKKRKTHSRSRSKERHRFSEWDARNYRRSRSRSRSQERLRGDRDERYREQDERYRHRDRDRGSDGDRAKERERHGARSKETERDLRVKIDKSKLRKIAIANVLAAVKAGEQGSDMDLATLKAGGKSVEELTDFCKKISEKERDYSDSDSDSDYGQHPDVEDLEGPFINHPFKLRDPSTLPNIIMNIRNSKQLPVLTPQAKATQSATLRLQFPVSSGSQHRIKENEWVPVEKTTTPPAPSIPAVTTAAAATPPAEVTPAVTAPAVSTAAATTTAAEAAAAIATGGSTPTVPPEDKVFPDPPPMPIDIGAIVSERLSLVRKLSENPYDVQALSSLYKSQEKSSQWAQSKFLPGHFTGSTGVQTLSQQELAGPDKRNQAWLKKDQLRRAAPVQGGIGMWLLQKMGWRQGEGLGKNNEGSKEPLMLDFKIDRKGLTSEGESSRKGAPAPRLKDLSGKHPVSALTELCNKRRWGPPNFITVAESGPDHKKNFLFKVVVNGVEYQPSTASANKKLAKAQAASICLQEMGLIPRE